MRKLLVLFLLLLIIGCSEEVKGDVPLTNEQVLKKGAYCEKYKLAIQMIYDDEWNVYAVKCVEGGFTGSGVKKKK